MNHSRSRIHAKRQRWISIAAPLLLLTLTGCSLYQSPGRKFLENQAFEFSGASAKAHLQACQQDATTTGWIEFSTNVRAHVFSKDSGAYELRVIPADATVLSMQPYSCDYKFSSAQEMFEKASAAEAYTLNTRE